MHTSTLLLLLPLLLLPTPTLTASPTSFCKCACFANSTIIPLDAPSIKPPSSPPPSSLFSPKRWAEQEHDTEERPLPEDPPISSNGTDGMDDGGGGAGGKGKGQGKEGDKDGEDRKEYRAGNCNDCNRQFCLDYNLPICRGAGVEDVFTTCFRGLSSSLLPPHTLHGLWSWRDVSSLDGIRAANDGVLYRKRFEER
ncbi:hypothetical protein ACLMJK_004656 [Lecanora helva]